MAIPSQRGSAVGPAAVAVVWLVVAAAGTAMGVGGPVRAQAGQASASAAPGASTPRDISGFWELALDSRKVPAANLLASVTRATLAERTRRDAYAIRWCHLMGMPTVMDSGRPLDIRQGATAVIIAPENASSPRYLYLDRATHIGDDVFDATTVGDSIARWEGDTLVVDTVGFHPDRGVTAIPGGGFRTATSHLVERYRLVNDGAMLSVTFTWTDPKVFRTPHIYEFRYHRLPVNYEPRPWAICNPYDEERARFQESGR
jgi:hypothetical protein